MIQRRCRPMISAIALPAFLGMLLSSCHSPESPQSSTSSPAEKVSEAVEGEDNETPTALPEPAVINNVETSATETAGSDSSSPKTEPSSSVNQDKSSSSATSPSSNSPSSALDSKATETQTQEPEKIEIAEIQIDETVCGAGGQEAYFETKVQDIYICKNAEGSLTYIATPKQKGNSFFLPAQKIQQGDLVGYAAIDETKTYIVTSGGFQLQENGKPTQSEKVIRRQLAKK